MMGSLGGKVVASQVTAAGVHHRVLPASQLGIAHVASPARDDGAGVPDVEEDHAGEHEDGVEDVEESLVAEDVAVVSLDVLDDTEDGSDHDEDGDGVEDVEEAGPGDLGGHGGGGRDGGDTVVEDGGDDDEEAEEEELDDETADDDVAAHFAVVGA